MKYRIVKTSAYRFKKYVPQYCDTQSHKWENWGYYYDGVQRPLRFWTKQGASKFLLPYLRDNRKVLKVYHETIRNEVWQGDNKCHQR